MEAAQPHQALVEETELFAGTPAIRMFGVASGVSVGATVLIRGYLLLAVLAGLMSALAVVRHTRQNEETGRAELVGAAVVGRHASLAAAIIVTVGANIVLAGVLGLAGIVTGQPAAGSFTAGVAVGAFGIAFAGIAAVTVQLSSTTRGANGLAAAVLGVAFVLSGVGNMLGFGLVFGAITEEVAGASGATAEWYARMGGSDQILDSYRASVIAMAGMAVAIYAVQMLLRMRAEEADGPLEPILATAVSRPRWVMSHVLNAGLGAVALLLVFAVSMGLAAGSVLGDVPAQLRALVEAGLVQLPGIMVIGSVAVAVTALLPRWAATVSWTVVMASILLGPLFGAATLQLPQWMQDVSPFTHIPKAPAAGVTVIPLVALIAISAALAAAGLASFRRRNLALPA